MQLQWLDRSGAPVGTLALPPGDWGRPSLSPDDRFAAIPKGDDLWRVDLARSVAVRLKPEIDSNTPPVWSPDGRRIVFPMGTRGKEELYEIDADGSGEARLVPSSPDLFKWPEDWVSAGLIFMSIGDETVRDLWIAPPASDGPPRPLIRTPYGEFGARVSPDGRWLAYLSTESGPEDVYIQSFPSLGHKVRVSTTGAGRVWWMPGSDEVCFRTTNGAEMMSVKLTRVGDELEVGAPTRLFRYPPDVAWSDFSHDGRRVLVTAPMPGAQKRRLRVITDWTGLVKQ
jgi:serine/threonine-protein kinase